MPPPQEQAFSNVGNDSARLKISRAIGAHGSQSFPDHLVAGFGPNGSWSDRLY
jgi:hypothetical protein